MNPSVKQLTKYVYVRMGYDSFSFRIRMGRTTILSAISHHPSSSSIKTITHHRQHPSKRKLLFRIQPSPSQQDSFVKHFQFKRMQQAIIILSFILFVVGTEAFSVQPPKSSSLTQPLFMSSFGVDGADYASKDSDYEDEEVKKSPEYDKDYQDEEGATEVVEEKPVPMSKNAGNRFVAIVWDQEIDTQGRDDLELHDDRDDLVEEHVLFCRKRNLYNETFNTDSMVDILRSLPM